MLDILDVFVPFWQVVSLSSLLCSFTILLNSLNYVTLFSFPKRSKIGYSCRIVFVIFKPVFKSLPKWTFSEQSFFLVDHAAEKTTAACRCSWNCLEDVSPMFPEMKSTEITMTIESEFWHFLLSHRKYLTIYSDFYTSEPYRDLCFDFIRSREILFNTYMQ